LLVFEFGLQVLHQWTDCQRKVRFCCGCILVRWSADWWLYRQLH